MAELTESRIEHLREWSAGKMGWTKDPTATHIWWRRKDSDNHYTAIMPVSDWHPETSLDQAVMVADRMGDWAVDRFRGSQMPYYGNIYVPRMDADGTEFANNYQGEADNPATALLLACAKADGVEVGDE